MYKIGWRRVAAEPSSQKPVRWHPWQEGGRLELFKLQDPNGRDRRETASFSVLYCCRSLISVNLSLAVRLGFQQGGQIPSFFSRE